MFTLQEILSSPGVFSRVHVTQSLVFCGLFVTPLFFLLSLLYHCGDHFAIVLPALGFTTSDDHFAIVLPALGFKTSGDHFAIVLPALGFTTSGDHFGIFKLLFHCSVTCY